MKQKERCHCSRIFTDFTRTYFFKLNNQLIIKNKLWFLAELFSIFIILLYVSSFIGIVKCSIVRDEETNTNAKTSEKLIKILNSTFTESNYDNLALAYSSVLLSNVSFHNNSKFNKENTASTFVTIAIPTTENTNNNTTKSNNTIITSLSDSSLYQTSPVSILLTDITAIKSSPKPLTTTAPTLTISLLLANTHTHFQTNNFTTFSTIKTTTATSSPKINLNIPHNINKTKIKGIKIVKKVSTELLQLNFTALPNKNPKMNFLPMEPIMGGRVTAAVQIGQPANKKISNDNKSKESVLKQNSIIETKMEHLKNQQKTTKKQSEITTTLLSTPMFATQQTPATSNQLNEKTSVTEKVDNQLNATIPLIEIPFEITNLYDLREYRKQLKELLEKVEEELHARKNIKSKPFVPVSAKIPNKLSTLFLQRIGAALNFSPNNDEKVELDKRLSSALLSSPSLQTKKQDNTGFSKTESLFLAAAAAAAASVNNRRFNPMRIQTVEECTHLSQDELVNELKQHGTYNPDLMAWDASGVFRFLDRTIADQYEKQIKPKKSSQQAVERNVEALERLFSELNLQCNVSSPEVIARLGNLTLTEPRRSIVSPSIRFTNDEIRRKRNILMAEDLMQSFNKSKQSDNIYDKENHTDEVLYVPFGCDKRGSQESGYLRLCGACQAIRKMPDTYFPPYINEVICDEDKTCLYFYDHPHGKCKQKHMNMVVLKNVGTEKCQMWRKFSLNVRISCECFVDEMSFFAKYV